jgi:hypothetical protein
LEGKSQHWKNNLQKHRFREVVALRELFANVGFSVFFLGFERLLQSCR